MITIPLDDYDKKLIIIKQLQDQKHTQRQIERLDNRIWSKPDKLLRDYKSEKQKLNKLSVFSLARYLP